MIELLLQAERALSVGLVDQAERLYRQAAEADPRNSIAVVGLARVALERADDREAYRQSRRALAIDPENAAASRLVARLDEVFAYRGETPPAEDEAAEFSTRPEGAEADAVPPAAIPPAPAAPDRNPPPTAPAPHRGLVDRLFRRNTR